MKKSITLFALICVFIMIPMKSYADDVSELDKRIQDGWANLYSKEKPVLINTQLKKSCLSLVRIMLDMTNVHHDLFLINNAESMKMMNHQKFNKASCNSFVNN